MPDLVVVVEQPGQVGAGDPLEPRDQVAPDGPTLGLFWGSKTGEWRRERERARSWLSRRNRDFRVVCARTRDPKPDDPEPCLLTNTLVPLS